MNAHTLNSDSFKEMYFKGDLPDMSGIYPGARVEIIIGKMILLNLPVTMTSGFCFYAEDDFTKVFVDMVTKESTILKDYKRPGLSGARMAVDTARGLMGVNK